MAGDTGRWSLGPAQACLILLPCSAFLLGRNFHRHFSPIQKGLKKLSCKGRFENCLAGGIFFRLPCSSCALLLHKASNPGEIPVRPPTPTMAVHLPTSPRIQGIQEFYFGRVKWRDKSWLRYVSTAMLKAQVYVSRMWTKALDRTWIRDLLYPFVAM